MPELTPDVVAAFRPLEELVPAHWRTGTATASDGTRLAWTETGDGDPVVLLHGVQVSGLTWLRSARALEARYRVVMPDLRGHGRSGPCGTATVPGAMVDDAVAVLQAAGLQRPVVVGHSLGAEVAGHLAAGHDLRGVVLADPPLAAMPPIDVDAPPPWAQRLFDILAALPGQDHAARMVSGLELLPPGGATSWDEADYVAFVDGQARFDLDLYRHLDTALPGIVAAPDVLAAIACPALLLTARPMLPGVDVDAVATTALRHLRNGRHVHFADSGHALYIERHERFVDVLGDFLTATAQDAAAAPLS